MQVFSRSGNDDDIDVDFAGIADSAYFSGFDGLQKQALIIFDGVRFIEEKDTAVCLLEQPFFLFRAGKRALH